MKTYSTILIDPPWPQGMAGKYAATRHSRPPSLPYSTMTIDELAALPVGDMAADAAHLWLWTTNQHLESGFHLMREWGFRYLAPVHWIKPSGLGNYFVHRTQTVLFGYRKCCRFPLARYRPNIIATGNPRRHSEKPPEAYELIEAISPGPRLELFARAHRPGWDVWGNEIESTITLPRYAHG
jgi:N6-adenosine-specific RNA methylase IME4